MRKCVYKNFHRLIFIILLLPVMVLAQNTGSITGKVTDLKGAPIPYANVLLQGTTTGAATDLQGNYKLDKVSAGNYTVQVTVIGYRESKSDISVTAGQTLTKNFSLSEDVLQMESVVITGTAGGSGIKKKDATFSITTISPRELEQLSPSSTAAALDLVPGVWSESSGGIAGANIMVRGLPSGGDAPFVTMSINGAPTYGTQTLSFFEQSTIFRIDETVGSTEALRGGPSSVFSNGEAGLTTNFNLKKGTDQTKGRVKYTTSDYNEQRIDAVLSGSLSEKLYYMVGGYFSTSPGIRNTQFNAENGKQFTFQLTKVFENGIINGYSRLTDDYGQWILPMSLGTGNDPGTFTQLGNATRYRDLQINEQGETAHYDFSKGRGWKGMINGLNFDYNLGGGWSVRDNLSYTAGDANTYGFVPNGSAIKVSDLKLKMGVDTIRTVSGKVLNSGFVQSYGSWVVEKQLKSFTNDISITNKIENHSITVGAYQAFWRSIDFWTLGNHILVENVSNGDIIKGIPADSVAGSWNYGINESGDARTFAIYAGDSWQLSNEFRVDIGARYNFFNLDYTLDAGAHPDGTTDKTANIDGSDWAGTLAFNYAFNKDMSVFARGSRASLFPNFDMIREGTYNFDSGEEIRDAGGNVTSVDGTVLPNIFNQIDLGFKFEQDIYSLFLTGFYNTVEMYDGGVGSTRIAAIFKTRTLGAEVDGGLSIGALKIKLIGTFQSGEITESPKAPETVGNKIWRQPDFQLRFAPSYDFQFSEKVFGSIYGALRYVGSRWNDRDNSYQLDPYTKIDLGVDVSTLSGLRFNVSADNLTDSEGLTEGDPRDPLAKNGRPILGRSFKFSITVDF
jgi:iron complex outermembrane recepter protein